MTSTSPRRVMLATDLTPAGGRAFDRAVQLAEDWDADLVVCHVIESSAARPWGMDRRVRNAETELDRLVRTSRLTRKVPRHIVIGDPADRTLEHARNIGADFIVTGPAHGKIVGEKLLGSTAARIVRRSGQPVLAVRRRPEGGYRSIVSAVDFPIPQKPHFCAGAGYSLMPGSLPCTPTRSSRTGPARIPTNRSMSWRQRHGTALSSKPSRT